MGPKTEKHLFPKVSREQRRTVIREISRECRVLEDRMDEDGQKYNVAYCSDRYTENRDKSFCIES